MAEDTDYTVARGDLLKFVGVAGAITALPAAEAHGDDDASANVAAPATTTKAGPLPGGYVFFNSIEAAFVEAAVDTLIPADAVGPGALELGVAVFMDRQLAGSYGKGYQLLVEGPFAEGTPQQGYQLALTPSGLMKAGIADVNAYTLATRNGFFADLAPEDRASVLHFVESGQAALATTPNATFFSLLLQLTIEGYFADPAYGGNGGKDSWKMIGFPGAGLFITDVTGPRRNKRYEVELPRLSLLVSDEAFGNRLERRHAETLPAAASCLGGRYQDHLSRPE